jgi:hypothetical protein
VFSISFDLKKNSDTVSIEVMGEYELSIHLHSDKFMETREALLAVIFEED